MSLANEMPWRPVYETYSAAVWLSLIPIYIFFLIALDLPLPSLWLVVPIALVMGGFRLRQAWTIWSLRLSLQGSPADLIDPTELAKFAVKYPEKRWLGIGFDWLPEHTQRVYDLKRLNPADFYAPEWFVALVNRLKGKVPPKATSIGAPWIQGIEPEPKNIITDYEVFYGHTIFFGTTGSGKTRMMEMLVTQDIHRGNVVIAIDPKGDKDLMIRMKTECARAGRRFIMFHLAFPNESVRFDCLKNFNRATEFPSRISSLIPSETGGDAFTAFAWAVLNAITFCMIETGEKPSLVKYRKYVETGIDSLLEKSLVTHFKKIDPKWDVIANKYIKQATKDITSAPSEAERIKGYLSYYHSELVPANNGSQILDALITQFEHDQTWFAKMINNLIPVLSMLTSGELGKMLSPDYDDKEDNRDIWDFQKVIASDCCIYIGLDSLSDATVASAVGSLLLSEGAAVAGSRYNFDASSDKKISLYVDEASEVVNAPFVTILNKGRGAGFMCYVFTQTKSDLANKLGSQDKARMMLGNFNNLVALRLRDGDTQEYISETFDEHYVSNKSISQGTGSNSDENVVNFGGRITESKTNTLQKAIPLDVLGKLPNFHYIASIAGGRVIKGKVPILKK